MVTGASVTGSSYEYLISQSTLYKWSFLQLSNSTWHHIQTRFAYLHSNGSFFTLIVQSSIGLLMSAASIAPLVVYKRIVVRFQQKEEQLRILGSTASITTTQASVGDGGARVGKCVDDESQFFTYNDDTSSCKPSSSKFFAPQPHAQAQTQPSASPFMRNRFAVNAKPQGNPFQRSMQQQQQVNF
jgi:hypothetical protein